jgi:SEC-C motif domain protein
MAQSHNWLRHLALPQLYALLFLCAALQFSQVIHGVEALAANNNSNKRKAGGNNAASSQKGFVIAPPTLEEVTSKFKTRLPENAESLPCPCGVNDGATYADCCAPFHRQEKFPFMPLQVLQSRYSAFYFRLIPYIIQTTHSSNRDYRDNKVTWAKDLNRKGMFDSFEFLELQPGPEQQLIDGNNNKAYIDFSVRLRARDGEQLETQVTEKSLFLRDPDTQIWSYASGEVRSGVQGLEDAILNQ